jgi:nitrogen regulatory protein P-II 1
MKKIEAFIRPHVLEDIRQELTKIGVTGLSVLEARGFGQQKGHTEFYRGAEYQMSFVGKLKIETVMRDELVDEAVDAILRVAATGKVGDGKIFVSTIDEAVRIRTGESGESVV